MVGVNVSDIFAIGTGPAISIAGLIFEGIGVIITLWPYIRMENEYIQYTARMLRNMYWGSGKKIEDEEWLKTPTGKEMLKQRKFAKIGVVFFAGGFFLQAFGNFIWALNE